MRDRVQSTPARQKARRQWRYMNSVVAKRAYERERSISAWLHDQANRDDRGVKGADQFARLLLEMAAVDLTPDQQDALILEFVHGVRRTQSQPLPAA